MSRRIICSSGDWDRRAPQPAHRRQHMHGPLQPMAEPRRRLTPGDLVALAIAGATLALFVLPLIFRSA